MSSLETQFENAIALSVEFHTHEKYEEFYMTFADKLGGFIGIYELIAKMAHALSEFEDSYGGAVIAWESMPLGMGWIEFVEYFVNALITESLKRGQLMDVQEVLQEVAKYA